MRKLTKLLVVFAAVLPWPAHASSRSENAGWRAPRSCHCDRYLDPHSSRYLPRSGAYRGGKPARY